PGWSSGTAFVRTPAALACAFAVVERPRVLSYAHHLAQRGAVDTGIGEVVECLLGDADDVMLDEGRAFCRSVLGMLEAAFPFQHRPAVVPVLRELREDAAEIDLAIAQRTEAAGPLGPALIARIDALPAGRVELGILHVEGRDALVIDVDE